MLESAKGGHPNFNSEYISWKPHGNAIIDMSFTQDDFLLASGCGGRSVKVTNVATQQVISTFTEHESSAKQVRFQPGSSNNSILASSGREGNIFIYDLRCNISKAALVINAGGGSRSVSQGSKVNEIIDAHRPGDQTRGPSNSKTCNQNWAFAKELAQPAMGERPREYGPISITSLAFLPPSQSHLLLSGSEFKSSIKVWDIRSIARSSELAVPISTTTPPTSHTVHRAVGITSITVSSDGSRIYSAARDNAVYVYSTSHLINGLAPELSTREISKPKRPPYISHHEGPGPISAFRHPLLMINSFYIKAAIRPARNGQAEMLAVGSTDQCALLFPTDERHFDSLSPNLEKYWDINTSSPANIDYTVRSTPRSRKSRRDRAIERERESCDGLKISERGTPLVEGHSREVSAVAWNSQGDLITVGDDYIVRCWRDGTQEVGGENRARALRKNGNAGGRRWGCGWADVNEKEYDESDVEDEE